MVTVTAPLAALFLLTLLATALVGVLGLGVLLVASVRHHRRRRAADLSIPVYYGRLALTR